MLKTRIFLTKEKHMDVKIYPSTISGSVEVEPFKAVCLRALIASAFASAKTEIVMRGETEDILSTINCLNKLGANISGYMGKTIITPIDFDAEHYCEEGFDVGDSVATFRFLAPSISVLMGGGTFRGRAKLPKNIEDFLFSLSGVGFIGQKLPIKLNGKLKGGNITIKASAGSQAISGILMALPLLKENSKLTVVGDIPSSYLVDVTLSVMKEFGVNVKRTNNTFSVSANEKYLSPESYAPEGDYSLAAYFLCAGEIGNGVTVEGLKKDTLQPEKNIYSLIEQCKTQSEINLSGTADLIYPLTVLACYKKTDTVIKGAKRKTQKSIDKFTAFVSQLTKMGAQLTETEDGVIVKGITKLKGGVFVDSFGDAKIAMSLAIASCGAEEPTYLLSAESATKSYPTFFNSLVKLGAKCQAM